MKPTLENEFIAIVIGIILSVFVGALLIKDFEDRIRSCMKAGYLRSQCWDALW